MVINRSYKLKNKKVLITAGPTWVPIDSVRAIGNIATGETGILLAKKLENLGAKVTLVLGPIDKPYLNKKIKIIHFKYFSELKNNIVRELKTKKYDIVIHSAAVSDYRPQTRFKQKVKANKKSWQLNLVPTEKIIDLIKKVDNSLFLVGFKFEPDVGKRLLIKMTKELMIRAHLDLAVANTINRNRYKAHIINDKTYGSFWSKQDLIERLIKVIEKNLK